MKHASKRSTPHLFAPAPRLSWTAKAVLLALGALVLRLIYLIEIRNAPIVQVLIGDARQYDAWAVQIAGGQWIGTGVFYQTPLYPYLLAAWFKLAGHQVFGVRLLQALFGALSCAGLAFAGRRFVGERAGLLAGALLAVYPPAIFFDGLIQKSSLDLVLVTVLLLCLAEFLDHRQWRWIISAGFSLGLLVLNRENARVLYPIIAVWMWWYFRDAPPRRRIEWVAALTLAAALTVLPVAIRNYSVGGEFLISTSQLGPNFYIGNRAGARGVYEPLVPGHGDPVFERSDATNLAERARGRTLSAGEVSNYWLERTLTDIRSQPLSWLGLMGRKLLLSLNASEAVDSESIEVYSSYSILLWSLKWISFGIVLPLAVFGAWLMRGEWRRLSLLWAMFFGLIGSVALFYVFARYRFPVVPITMLFAGAGMAALLDRRSQPFDWRSRGVLFASATLIVAYLPLNAGQDATYLNVGAELIDAGRPEAAIPILQKGVAAIPDYAPLHFMLGRAFSRAGDAGKAMPEFNEALRLRPEFAEAHNGLAIALETAGRMTEALAQYREAARLRPDSADMRWNLGLALSKSGQLDQAVPEFLAALKLNPDDTVVHAHLAVALQRLGRFTEAMPHFEASIRLKPDAPDTQVGFAIALRDAGRSTEAIEHLRYAARLRPSDAEVTMMLANLLFGTGRIVEAVEQYERGAALLPSSVEAHALLGQAYAQAGRLENAVTSLEDARSLAQSAGNADAIQQIENAIRVCRAQMLRRKR